MTAGVEYRVGVGRCSVCYSSWTAVAPPMPNLLVECSRCGRIAGTVHFPPPAVEKKSLRQKFLFWVLGFIVRYEVRRILKGYRIG